MNKGSFLALRLASCAVILCASFLYTFSFAQVSTFQRFDTQTSFIGGNSSPTIVSYDSFPNARFATYEQTFATEGVKIKPNDPNYTQPLWVNDWTNLLPGKEFAITGKEGMEFTFTTPVNAFGYDFVERVASIPGYESPFVDSTFVISIYSGVNKLTEYTFTPANDVASFFGVSSTQSFDRVSIQETVGSVDDELYGKLYIKRNPPVTPSPACGNPRAKVTFGTYDPAVTGNSGTNAWTSLTLGNKAIISENQFFDIKDGTYAIDDGAIVTSGLQNFAVSRHDGYIEFLALGRRLPAYYGYYEGTITFENVQVDRVEGGLTTASWADIGLETTTEGDVVTKQNDYQVNFKLAFANQGDGFRVYLKNPTSTPCNCPTGQVKIPDPKSPVCIVRAIVKAAQDTDFILTGYDHLVGNCTLAAGSPQPPQAPSSQITVTAGQQRTSWLQGSPWASQLDSLLTCPANTTKTACMFTYGAGALGEITCGCYPNGYTAKTFVDPKIDVRPVYARSGSPERFCAEQGYVGATTVKQVYNYTGTGAIWGEAWGSNNGLEAIKEVECTNKPNISCQKFTNPTVHGLPVYARPDSPKQFCKEQGYNEPSTVVTRYNYLGNGSLWNGSVWEINPGLEAITEVSCCKLEDKQSDTCVTQVLSQCSAGQYWCNSENTCKPAGQSCGTLTCNNNNICDTGESCNCGDCTNGGVDDKDRCGLTPTGTQMVCTKDKQNTTTPGGFDATTAQANFDIVNGKLATYLSAPGNLNVAAGEFGSTATELTITQDSQLTYFSSFTQEEAWTRAKELLAIPTSAQVLWSKKSAKYENDALGDNERYLYSYVVEPTPGVRRQILFATEYLPSLSLGWRKVYLIGKDYPIPQTGSGTVQVGACCPVGTQWSSTANACLTDKCAEGQYYCHEELKCKPANQPCSAVVCEDKVVFKYTGAVQNYTVPADVSKIQIKAWGAAGGSGAAPWIYIGAAGGYAQGDIGVTGGEQFKIVVGEGGKRASTLRTFGGGGHGTNSWGGSGGGLSGVFRNSFTHANSLLIAGGGSGASGGGNIAEGFGGGLQGNRSMLDYFSAGYAHGGSQTAGGVSVAPYSASLAGSPGGPLSGGDANNWTCTDGGAGGGGGGYYGGAGGVGDWCTFPASGDTDGGGGSGYLHTSLTNASFATTTTADAKTAPKKTDVDYVTGVAEGKNTGDGSGGNGLVVITECRPKPTAFCNNNAVCETNESCNCADCNDQIDHCGVKGTDEQLICTKDTTPPCFSDKFPYCFPACLDGYTRNASGQCVTNSPPVAACQNFTYPIKDDGFVKDNAASVTQYCTEKGFTSGSPISSTANGARKAIWNGTAWTFSGDTSSYSKEVQCCGGTVPALTCQNYKPPQVSGNPLHIQPSSLTRFCSEKGSSDAYMVSQSYTGGSMAVWGGTSWGGDDQGYKADELNCCSTPTTAATCQNFTYPTSDNINPSTNSYVANTNAAANTFCTSKGYTSGTLISGGNIGSITNIALEVKCCGNVAVSCQNYPNPAIGSGLVIVRPSSTGQFCREKGKPEPFMKSWTMTDGILAVWNGTSWYGDPQGGGATSLDCCTLTAGSTSTPTPPATSTNFQNFTYPIKNDGYVKDDTASATQFCTEKGFTSATILSTASSGARKSIWNGTAWTTSDSTPGNIKEIKCSGGTPQNLTCETFSGHVQSHGGYLSIQPVSTAQFCKEAGYDFPQLTAQYSTSSSCRLWNGTSWYEDVACVAASGLQCCQNPAPTTNQCITPKMKVNFTRTENAPNSIILGSGTVLTNNPSFDLTSNGVATLDSTLLDNTTHFSIRRQNGYVEFMARNPTATNAYYTGTITLENATVDRVEGGLLTYSDPGYGLEGVDGDSVTKTNSTVVNFNLAFTYPGDGFRIYYTTTAGSAVCTASPMSCTIRRVNNNSLANIASCNAGEKRVGGGCANTGGGAYRYASFPIAKNGTYTASNGTLLTALQDGWICDTGSTGTNVEASAVCCTGSDLDGTYTIRKESDAYVVSTVECQAGEKRIGGGCRNVGGSSVNYGSFPIVGGQNYQDGARYTIPAPIHDGWLCDPGSSGQVTEAFALCVAPAPGKNPVINIQKGPDTSAPAFGVCQTGETLLGGGCRNTAGGGYHYGGVPMKTGDVWASRSFTAPGNGFACNDGSTGTSVESYALCLSVPTSSAPPSTYSPEPQLGACCPPGSAWNSVENRCIPTTCGEGQFYCAAQKKCLAGGTTCDTTVCNNNGLCEGEESCQCGDCIDGPTQTDPAKKADDKDKCSIIGGTQAMCSDDLPNDNKPGACCLPPQTWNTATGTCQECTNTQAPSELKAGVDQPYISCTGNGDTTQTHFKYRLTKVLGTPSETPYISPTPTPVGTQVLHTATSFTEGSYKVECFYGTASNVPTDTLSTPHTCTKTIAVKTGTVQGCDALITHKDSLLTSLLHDANPFSASSRCASRTFDDTLTQPFRLFYGNAAPITLEYDSVFAMLEIVGLSVPNFHSFTTGNTDIRCAVKVGGGYSTNSACFKTACVGGTCSLPQTFSVVNSANHTCTTEDKSVYDIGCNPLADQTTKDTCAKWFSDAFATHALSANSFTTHFTFGGADTPIVCTKYPPGGLPGGLNMYANFVCKALLPNGEEVEIYGAEDNGTPIKALQTTAYTTKKDNQVPNLQPVTYYSSESLSASSLISTPTRWQKTNVTAVVTCTDAPGVSDGDTCACAPTVATTSTTPDLWSPGTPDSTVGADIMRYTRTITSSLNGATVAVRDTAGNISPDARTISIGVDTVAPTVNITTTGTAPSLAVTITATDNTGGSGIWKDNIQTQTYLATAPVPTFDDKCNLTSADTLLYETYSPTGTPLALTKSTATPITLNTSTHKLAYCIQDNAGNITKGFYPSVPVACFSATNLPTVPGTTPAAIPSIATYVAPLIARIAPTTGTPQLGYGMSTDATNANCFRGIITSNVTRLISNQYNASTASTVDWNTPAKVKSNPTLSNTNGYYYHTAMSPNLLTINTSPSGTGPKVVYAEGADIQINADINYKSSTTSSSDNTLLIIIAKRATSGTNPAGGNIYIHPNVKNIDAILITDGAIMNGVNGTPKDYITNPTDLINRLTINGRIYSMNTRGGSIDSSILTSNNLGMITTNTGKLFANNASLTTNATPAQAAAQDLERFRVINDDGNKQCTLFLNYKTIPINTLPPILQRPSGYAGGGCGF